jgi:predicted Rossmann fold nucleotide-binding protein DprA/Smf involved in DNA uptake
MIENTASPGAQVALMLTSKLGQPQQEDTQLLRQSEFVGLVRWLKEQNLSFEDLLEADPAALEQTGLESERLAGLLGRGMAAAISIEKWSSAGIWVIGWDDELYPIRYKERLKGNAPPVLFGVGDPGLLSQGGLCIVGSRRLDEPALELTQQVGHLCARQGMQVISGGAKGADAAAMHACLQHGGSVVGVLADSLARAAVGPDTRDWVRDGCLTLISPFDPGAHFLVYNAMGRNKLLYTLADWALVTHSAYNEGGTWSGAKENLSKRWVPLFVADGPDAPEGNRQLIKAGGIAFGPAVLESGPDLSAWLQEEGQKVDGESIGQQLNMF